jgi:hypothetical protein
MSDLTQILDRQAIEEQIIRIGVLLDDDAFDTASSIFTEDVAIETPGGAATGIDAVTRQAEKNHDGIVTQHIFSNVLVELNGDSARARADVVGRFAKAGALNRPFRTVGGRYEYGVTRTEDGWRINEMKMTPRWLEGELT